MARQDQKIEILNALVQVGNMHKLGGFGRHRLIHAHQTLHRNERVKWEIPCQILKDQYVQCSN